MRKRVLILVLLAATLLSGCDSKMESADAQTIKVEVKAGSGKVAGQIKANDPNSAGISQSNFDFDSPGSFEVKGGPSEYSVTFNSLTPEQLKSWSISVDGRELQRGPDMVVEDDKGPRASFAVLAKAPSTASTP